MIDHPLITTLRSLKGNPRSVVFTEPLWGIPYNLYAPYISVYMLALGVKDAQIGLITSIGLACQIVFALLSGAITDKLGRKRTTLVSDILCWSVPCLIWAFSQNFVWFLVAAIINSVWRVSHTSWSCLLVEDAPQDQMVSIWSWIYIAGLLSAFVSPIAGELIKAFSLVPTVRGLYLFAFVLMTTKFLVLNYYATETRQGQVRRQETKGQPFLSLLGGYGSVIGQILGTPRTLLTLGILLVISICSMISGTFWGIAVTEKLAIPKEYLSLYAFVRSGVMLLFFFLVMPHISGMHFMRPMLVGLTGFVVSQLLLITMPEKSYLLLVVATALEACSFTLVNPFVDSMVVATVDPAERARILAILYVIVITLTSPFGWIAGQLSENNRMLPFVLNVILFTIGGILVVFAAWATRKPAASPLQPESASE